MQSVLIKKAGLPIGRWLGFFWGEGGRMKIKFMLSTIFMMIFSVVSLTHANTEILGITWGDSKLVTFDPYSGNIIQEHLQLNPNESFRGLAYDSNHDNLYASSQGNGNLYSINPKTLEITFIGKFDKIGDVTSLTYDPNTDTLYAAAGGKIHKVNVNNAELTTISEELAPCLNSLSYNDKDGQFYAYVVDESGSWDSPYKSRLVRINPIDATMTTLFETPYHTILGLAKIPDQNVFITWINWDSHFYGEVKLNTQKIFPLGNKDPVGVNSNAIIYKNFYVGSTTIIDAISEFFLKLIRKMRKWAGDFISIDGI